jgi:hypothetical protein
VGDVRHTSWSRCRLLLLPCNPPAIATTSKRKKAKEEEEDDETDGAKSLRSHKQQRLAAYPSRKNEAHKRHKIGFGWAFGILECETN